MPLVVRSRASTLAAATLLSAAVGCLPRPEADPTPGDALAAYLAGRRPFAARLSAQGPVTVPVGAPNSGVESLATGRLGRRLGAAAEDADPHLRGVFRLLAATGAAALDRAVEDLSRAAATRPAEAAPRTDLVVAYLVRAERVDRPEDRVAALTESRRALELAPGDPAALYDRALALDGLGLVRLATAGWRAFLAVEPAGVWADEARARLAVLEGPSRRDRWKLVAAELAAAGGGAGPELRRSIAGFAQEAREHAMEELLPAWGAAVLAGDAGAAAGALAGARAIAGELVDRTVADTVASIDAVAGDAVRRRLAEGLVSYGEGRSLFAASDSERARAPLERAKERLASSGCPMWRWSELWLAGSDLHRSDYPGLDRRLEVLAAGAAEGWRVLGARARWAAGLAAIRTGRPADAAAAYRDAATRLEEAGEVEDLGSALALLAEAEKLFEPAEAVWRLRARALGLLAAEPLSVRRHNLLWEAGSSLLAGPRAAAARDFLDEDVALADRLGAPVVRMEARTRRGEVLTAHGDSTSALADLEVASVAAAEIPAEPLRRKAEALVARRRAEALLATDASAGLVDEIAAFAADLASGVEDAVTRALGVELYDRLLAPFGARLAVAETLVVVPDRALHRLPFAASRPSVDGPHLGASHGLAFAGSVAPGEGARNRRSKPPVDGVLLVGDPALGPRSLLPGLPGARGAIDALARRHTTATVLLGELATRRAFLQALPSARVVYVAAHATFDRNDPGATVLWLAPSGDDDGNVRAGDLATLNLAGLEFVVLSACSTAARSASRTAGVSGLARAFLDAGAAAVVGYLWPIDDRQAGAILAEIDRVSDPGEGPLARLAALSLAMRQSSLVAWAGLQTVIELS